MRRYTIAAKIILRNGIHKTYIANTELTDLNSGAIMEFASYRINRKYLVQMIEEIAVFPVEDFLEWGPGDVPHPEEEVNPEDEEE